MDALALLCNLHADGPFTLQRLRRSGCESLGVLLELSPLELANYLDGNERTADRFLREAELLAERLEEERPWRSEEPARAADSALFEDDLLEEEEEEEPEDEEAYAYDEEDEDEEDAEEEEAEEEEEVYAYDEVDEDEEALEDDVVAGEAEIGPVLDAWRDADLDSPPEDPVDYELPRLAAPAAANQALDELHLAGLDADLKDRLREVGVLSLKGLLDASPLELARSLPLPFTRVKHLQFLANRVWHGRSEPLSAPESYDELVAAERLDASGPFAGLRKTH